MPAPVKNRRYVGYSSTSGDGLQTLYDAALINADLTLAFNIRKGEVLTDPSQGFIAWSLLFEPATPETINIIQNDAMKIFNAETRVSVQSISITASTDPTDPGYVMQAQLLYIGQNVSATFTQNFLQSLAANDIGE